MRFIIPRETLRPGDRIQIKGGELTIIRGGPACGLCHAAEPLDEHCDQPRCADVLACLDRRSQPRAGGGSGG